MELLNRYYTEEGVIALNRRLEIITKLYLEGINYPFTSRMYGFPLLKIHSKQHHEGMIDDLSQILNKSKVNVEVKNNGN